MIAMCLVKKSVFPSSGKEMQLEHSSDLIYGGLFNRSFLSYVRWGLINTGVSIANTLQSVVTARFRPVWNRFRYDTRTAREHAAHLSLRVQLSHHLVPLCSCSSTELAISILLLTPAVHTPNLPNAACLQNNVIFFILPLQPSDSIHSFLVPCGFQQKNSFRAQCL